MRLLIGDNPFHGVSHLSQARARARGAGVKVPEQAAEVVTAALASGADGCLFSINETTLAILHAVRRGHVCPPVHAIIPYSYGHVRAANALGGIPGLARKIGGEIARSLSARAAAQGLWGVAAGDPRALVRAYVGYETARLRRVTGHGAVASVLLHEVVTDMALALSMDWLFHAFVREVVRSGAVAGFNTRNLPWLVQRLRTWGIAPRGLVFAAPFNPIGFQMSPSQEACERALEGLSGATVIAFSVLAAGHLTPDEAVRYVAQLPNLAGLAIGVSTIDQARQTFGLFRSGWQRPAPPLSRVPL